MIDSENSSVGESVSWTARQFPLGDIITQTVRKNKKKYLALLSGAPVIPVFTNGKYFTWQRARVIIGTPIDAQALTDSKLSEKENLAAVTKALRDKIIDLERQLNEQAK